MDDEAAFLAAIQAAPDDDTSRLVYADWLDEHGRQGGDFLRIECQLATIYRKRDQQERLQAELVDAQYGVELVCDDPPYDSFDNRWSLFAQLRTVSLKLDPHWIAKVCRIPEDDIYARVREIQAWLQRQVSVAEMLSRMARWDEPPPQRESLWQRVRTLFKRSQVTDSESPLECPRVRTMRAWVEANMEPGDELWEYDTGGESWAHLCGEMGYAIVRNGKVIEFTMLMMN